MCRRFPAGRRGRFRSSVQVHGPAPLCGVLVIVVARYGIDHRVKYDVQRTVGNISEDECDVVHPARMIEHSDDGLVRRGVSFLPWSVSEMPTRRSVEA
jgi:hypothetical protein